MFLCLGPILRTKQHYSRQDRKKQVSNPISPWLPANPTPEEPPAGGDAVPPPAYPAGRLDSSLLPVAGEPPPRPAHPARRLDSSLLPVVGEAGGRPQATSATGARQAAGRRRAGATLLVGGAFALSRVLGLVRSQVIAAQFPPGTDLDTYFAAFNLPDLLFLLIIGGAVGSAFIPVFSGLWEQKKTAAAWRLASTLINASVVLLAVAGIVAGFLAPALVGLVIAPGFSPPKQAATVELMRIMLFSPLFLGLGGWAQGILNARHSFLLPALAPVVYNGAIIAGALFLAPIWGISGLAVGVVLGALLHFLVQVPGLVRIGMRYRPFHFDRHDEGAGEVARLMLPRIVGQAAFQANIVALTNIASHLAAGQLSGFQYAYALMMLPHGVLAMSLATVLFPTMTAQIGRGDRDGMRATLSRGLRTLIFLTLPAAVGLGLLRREIVGLLFQFGKFDQNATVMVAAVLGWFAWGLVAYVVVELLTRGYYALHDTRTPVLISLVTVALNIALSWLLVFRFGLDNTGLAFSLALTTTLEMLGLLFFLRPKLPGLFDRAFLRAVAISGLAAALMAGVLQVVMPFLEANIVPARLLSTDVSIRETSF